MAATTTIAGDTVTLNSFTLGGDGGSGVISAPNLTINGGAHVAMTPSSSISLVQTGPGFSKTYGQMAVANATLSIQGKVIGALDVQAGGTVAISAGGNLTSPATAHTPVPLAAVEQGGTLSVSAGANVDAAFARMDGTYNIDAASVQGGMIGASGLVNGSNGATMNGLTYLPLGNISNTGTIAATSGLFTIASNSIAGSGHLKIHSGAILSLVGNSYTTPNHVGITNDIDFDPNATLILDNRLLLRGAITGFSAGDTIALSGDTNGLSVSAANGMTTVTTSGGTADTFMLAGDFTADNLALGTDDAGHATIRYAAPAAPAPIPAAALPIPAAQDPAPAPIPPSTPASATPAAPTPTPVTSDTPSSPTALPAPALAPAAVNVLMTDTTTGVSSSWTPEAYGGPVSGLSNQFISVTPHNLNILAAPDMFIHTGDGTDAIQALSGTNVLDGGGGSNMLTGGTGFNTFFVDARHPSGPTWSTVIGAHSGDNITVWGISPTDAAVSYVDGQGAANAIGLTMHAFSQTKPDASFTLAGFSTADLSNGRVVASYSADVSNPYLNLHIN